MRASKLIALKLVRQSDEKGCRKSVWRNTMSEYEQEQPCARLESFDSTTNNYEYLSNGAKTNLFKKYQNQLEWSLNKRNHARGNSTEKLSNVDGEQASIRGNQRKRIPPVVEKRRGVICSGGTWDRISSQSFCPSQSQHPCEVAGAVCQARTHRSCEGPRGTK